MGTKNRRTGNAYRRIAIPDWHGQVSPVFDVAGRLLVVDLEEGREIARKVVVLTNLTPARRVLRLKALGVETLVCGAISRPLERFVTRLGIRVVSLVSGPLENVERFMALGQPIPETYLLPGCRQPRIRHGNSKPITATVRAGATAAPASSGALTMEVVLQLSEEALGRIRGEYDEMPGLKLTAAQARRLWGLDAPICDTLLAGLVRAGFLRRTQDGSFVRAEARP